jgi:NitT/TauT family transport system permease protein
MIPARTSALDRGRTLVRSPSVSAKWGLRAASLGAFLLVWETLGRSMNSLLLPTAGETAAALFRLVETSELWQAMWRSNQAMLAGYLAALAIGVPLGLAAGRWRRVEQPLDLYLNFLLVTPISAMIPIFIMALGLGLGARSTVVLVFSLAVVAVNTRAGLKSIDPSVVEMARAFCASEMQMWAKVLLPGALAGVMAGARLGLARAISGMVAVELLLVSVGFGRLLLRYQADFEAGSVYAVILVVVTEAVVLSAGLRRLEKRWNPSATEANPR